MSVNEEPQESIMNMDSAEWRKMWVNILHQCMSKIVVIKNYLIKVIYCYNSSANTLERLHYVGGTIHLIDSYIRSHSCGKVCDNIKDRITFKKLMGSLYFTLNKILELLDILMSQSPSEVVNLDYLEISARFLCFELIEMIPIRPKIIDKLPIDDPIQLLREHPIVASQWDKIFGKKSCIDFDEFLGNFVRPLWGDSPKLIKMINWSINLVRDNLATAHRVNYFLKQFYSPECTFDELINNLPSGFLAHVNRTRANEIIRDHVPVLPKDRKTVVWRFSRSYPHLLSFDVYDPVTDRIDSYRNWENTKSIIDAIREVTSKYEFLSVEIEDDQCQNKMDISHSLYSISSHSYGIKYHT